MPGAGQGKAVAAKMAAPHRADGGGTPPLSVV